MRSPSPGMRKPWTGAYAGAMLRTLLPSFVADWIWPSLRSSWKLHPTSYLDGLRGVASFIVFFCHYTELRHGYFTPTYGFNENEASAFIQLPFLRLVYSGRPMVHIFFVISGFVLSYKPLKMLHAGDPERCFSALASSTFRRPIRLFMPCAASTLGIAALAQSGFLYQPAESVYVQLRNWKNVFFHSISWPWAWDQDLMPSYDIHLWTIPIEFAHSMLLFLAILALSRLRTLLRQAATVLLIVYCMCSGKWAGFEFLAGLFLAEVHVLQSLRLSRGVLHLGSSTGLGSGGGGSSLGRWDAFSSPRGHRVKKAIKILFHGAILVTALYVDGWPNDHADQTWGIRYLLAKTPTPFLNEDRAPQKFWFGIAAIFTVWSVGEVDTLRRVFESGVAQYCGRISYAIYIMHGPGLDYFQDRVLGWPREGPRGSPENGDYSPGNPGSGVKGMIGVETPLQRVMTWFVGVLILGPIIVWISDLFWRFVDAPIVKFGRTLEMACVEDASSSAPSSSASTLSASVPSSSSSSIMEGNGSKERSRGEYDLV